MKLDLLRLLLLFIVLNCNASACDLQLSSNILFSKDCEIQDKFESLKLLYSQHGSNIDDVVEYKALRFIDRKSWQKNINKEKNDPRFIYRPYSLTWDIWVSGINSIFSDHEVTLQTLFFNLSELSRVNKLLLTDSRNDISATKFDNAGELRNSIFDGNVGFCSILSSKILNEHYSKIEKSMNDYVSNWEKLSGISFKKLVKQYNGESPSNATLGINLSVRDNRCNDRKNHFTYYVSSSKVEKYLNWLGIFIDYNLKLYHRGELIVSPIEFASFVQKVFVTIHPFHDGNGRTSRVIQDLILKEFGMPYAPSGDLQSDILLSFESYRARTYSKFESMLNFLEKCLDESLSKEMLLRCESYSETL